MGDQTPQIAEKNVRREPRFAVNDLARVTVLTTAGEPSLDGRVCDLSKSGLALLTDTLVPEGSIVSVKLDQTVVVASVRYCRVERGGFRVGLEIDDVNFDEPETLQPSEPAPDSLWKHLKQLYRALTTGT